MVAADNRHSRIVGWVKVLAPLTALALLSTLFLFARDGGQGEGFPVAEITALARDQGITAPAFSGVTEAGAVIAISAETARPGAETQGLLVIDRPQLTLEAADGTTLQATAGSGSLNTADQTASLEDLARLETSSGFTMETTALDVDLSAGVVETRGRLAIAAPFGLIEAGHARIHWAETGEGQMMVLSDGVRLVYDPPEP